SLRAQLPAGGAGAETASTVAQALGLAMRPPATPVVCVAGSLFVVGEALTHLGGTEGPCRIENGADSMGSLEGARDTS
ncbi:MAG: hypothetical protein ACREM3_22025, partial [Candidatus Rokuibacteriota bacterium]